MRVHKRECALPDQCVSVCHGMREHTDYPGVAGGWEGRRWRRRRRRGERMEEEDDDDTEEKEEGRGRDGGVMRLSGGQS